jgi:predicted MPP superfamily phosphohydrolase
MLERRGIPVYENDAARLVKDGTRFWLAGLGDQLAFFRGRRKRGSRIFQGVDDLDGTLAKVTDSAPVILLAHEPDVFPRVPKRVALTLSGHTHGGQVRLLGYSPLVPSRYGNRYAYGHCVEGGRHLVVTGGLGCSILPVRLGVPPEIVMVDVAAA